MTRKTMLRITRVVVVAVLCPIGASNGDTIVIDDFNGYWNASVGVVHSSRPLFEPWRGTQSF